MLAINTIDGNSKLEGSTNSATVTWTFEHPLYFMLLGFSMATDSEWKLLGRARNLREKK